ncbi:MAG: transglutaminase-like domain-containing protein [bacterium]|nr:transglutaminase-like domain-containing protein [bacterium]
MTSSRGTPESDRPSPEQIATTIALLADDTGVVQASARERLLLWGDAAVEQLENATEATSMLVRLRSRAVLRSIEVRKDLRRIGRLQFERSGRGYAPTLLEGSVLLARIARTFVPTSAELGSSLRRHALELKREFVGRSLPTCARLLAERLHDQLGLTGQGVLNGPGFTQGDSSSPDDSGSPAGGAAGDQDLAGFDSGLDAGQELASASVLELDHVLLHRVLDQGIGLPVSLSMLYMLVARWAGLSAAGVALPDHFLVRLHGVRPVLLDPFHAGRTITKADCSRYLRANGHDQVRHHLRDLDDREVLVHYLRALQRAATYRGTRETRQALARAFSLLEPA